MALPTRRSGSQTPTSMGYLDVEELDKYKLISNIGKGSFGVISKVQRIEDGKEFALKQLDYAKMTERDRKQILAEVAILEALKHRNIVQLIQKIKDPKNERIYIVMEFCTSGDLGSLIRKAQRTNQPLHEDKIWNIFLQITLALHHCHWPNERPSGQRGSNGGSRLSSAPSQVVAAGISRTQVLHRDLKPDNVFLSGEFVKLGDFGLSKDMAGNSFTSTFVGTPLYMPPEILAENRYDTKSDIWSLGCLVYEMCALTSPFSTAKTQEELISMVKSGKLPSLPPHISPALKYVIRAMLNLNPSKRPSTKDLLDMEEMKLHRKLFMVQNQTSLLAVRKEEIQQYEVRLQARTTAIEQREQALAEREGAVLAREQAAAEREEMLRENQKRMSMAAESLRGQWDKLREVKEEQEREKIREETAELAHSLPVDPPPEAPQRPALEERKTLPVPAIPRSRHPLYEDTPSKIPFAVGLASPVPLESRFGGTGTGTGSGSGLPGHRPLRRLASKSLSNLAAQARASGGQQPDSEFGHTHATPVKQTMGGRHPTQRTSIGSPDELERVVFVDDITMASASMVSPAPSMLPTPSPFLPRPRKFSTIPIPELCDPGSSSSALNDALRPTLIPAPTFIYRPEATPAKWPQADPDLPSPFLRRLSTQPNLVAMAGSIRAERSERERQPLGGIQAPQPPLPLPASSNSGSNSGGNLFKKIPRSKSGNLHQHVLRTNAAARTSNESGGGGKLSHGGSSSALSAAGVAGNARARAAAAGKEAGRVLGL